MRQLLLMSVGWIGAIYKVSVLSYVLLPRYELLAHLEMNVPSSFVLKQSQYYHRKKTILFSLMKRESKQMF